MLEEIRKTDRRIAGISGSRPSGNRENEQIADYTEGAFDTAAKKSVC